MKINEVKKALDILLPVNGKQVITPMLYGFPGIGKSSLIQEIAEERGIQVVDLRLSQHDNTDFKFPIVGEHSVRWITADFLPVVGNPRFEGTKGILFLDEINLASQDVIASVFQLIHDRRIGDNKIMDTWHIVAAGNLGFEDGNDNVVQFTKAFKDRLLPFIVDKFNKDEWVTFVTANGCSSLVVDYIKANPTKLYVESKFGTEEVFVTPRRWEKLGLLLETVPQNQILSTLHLVGEGFLYGEIAEFMEFVQETLNSIEKVNIKDLFHNYATYEKLISEMERDKVFQMNNRVTKYLVTEELRVTDKLVTNFHKYVSTLSDDLKISFLRGIKNEGVKMHGKETAENKSFNTLLRKIFELDKDLSARLAEMIKKGVGFSS